MKKVILSMALVCISMALFAQNSKFELAMKKHINSMDTAQSIESYRVIANSFERMATAETKEWLPDYYVAFCYIIIANMEKSNDKVDDDCDKADGFLDKAELISKDNSEIYSLKSWSASSRIRVNPMMRGQKYGSVSAEYNQKAMKFDPTNPRPYYLSGMGKFYTPSAFGGGKDKAQPLFEEAIKRYKVFKPANSIMPTWGQKKAEEMLAECKKP
jgi:hypothetical protein